MRRNFSGELSARIAADGTWRIRRRGPAVSGPADSGPADSGPAVSGPAEFQIIAVGADSRRVAACGSALHELDIEWHAHRVLITAASAGAATMLEASSVLVHESLPNLYGALPLADFDARARRFWRRVFLLVRVPGGRRLLGILAHASRNKR